MSLPELAYRGKHEASKWFERIARGRPAVDPRSLLEDRAPELADPGEALRVLRKRAAHRFFAGAGTPSMLAALRNHLPGDCGEVVAAATAILVNRRFDLLGYKKLSFGNPVDWHLDPVWAQRSPLVHWGFIDPLDPAQVGDSKVVWELNRHQWMVGLAQAWLLTGDERYGVACLDAIDHWIDANPPGSGINWASSLEVALRLIAWCWSLTLLRDLPALAGERLTRTLSAIWQHAAHVRRYLSYYFSPNTHLTAEALALFYVGVIWPEFRDAPRWRRLGARILIAQSARQISGDGVYFEQSTCYHRYTVEIYLHFLLLADRNRIAIPREVRDRIARMVDFMVAVRQPDGSIPVIGDADGGALLPLTRRSSDDSRGLFAVAAAMFGRQDFAWASGGGTPELLWLLGTDGLETFRSLTPALPEGSASRLFSSGGYAVMRSGWERDAHQMIVDTGPLGCPTSSGHGHADLLSVQCNVFGDPCLVDPGTYCYTTEPAWRDYFRGTAAHSTIRLDGVGQSEPAGPFRWTTRPRVRLRRWQSTPDFDLIDAESNAFLKLPDPVVHRRRVVFVKPSCFVIVDDLAGVATHHVELMFQFAPIPVLPAPNGWHRARTASGATLWIAAFTPAPLRGEVRSGELDPIRGWISPEYGRRLPAPMLTYSCIASLPWRVVTVLLPDRESAVTPPTVHPILDATGLVVGLSFDGSIESVRIDDQWISVTRELGVPR